MKCVAIKATQARRDDGKIKTYRAGEVDNFEECPPNFEALQNRNLDFLTASEAELMESDFDMAEAEAVIEKEFKVKLSGRSKRDIVLGILDARYRHIPGSNDKVPTPVKLRSISDTASKSKVREEHIIEPKEQRKEAIKAASKAADKADKVPEKDKGK